MKTGNVFRIALIPFAANLIQAPAASSQMQGATLANTPVCTAPGDQRAQSVAIDERSGALMAWEDMRTGATANVYVQRLDSLGGARWAPNGVPAWVQAQAQLLPQLTPDAQGGCILAWKDFRGTSAGIYVQRFSSDGTPLWQQGGIRVAFVAGDALLAIVSDDSGGAIIAWEDSSLGYRAILAQRLGSNGNTMWQASGVRVSAGSNTGRLLRIFTDKLRGAIAVWSGLGQRVSSTGELLWDTSGVAVPGEAQSDESGGLLLQWHVLGDFGYSWGTRIDGRGRTVWSQVVARYMADGPHYRHARLVATGGGASAVQYRWFRQLLGPPPAPPSPWCSRLGSRFIAPDGTLGTISDNWECSPPWWCDPLGRPAFQLQYNGMNGVYWYGVKDSVILGAPGFASGGGTAIYDGNRGLPGTIGTTHDNRGGAFFVWQQRSPGGDWDLYAQHLGADGSLPIRLANFSATRAGATVRLEWLTLSEVNNYGFEVQRRPDGEAEFVGIPGGFVPGHGTTTEPQHYAFVDNVPSHGAAMYRLKQIDLDGTVHYTDPIPAQDPSIVGGETVPLEFALHQNYPNPFNPSTTIRYALPQRTAVTLVVYNTLGQEVTTVVRGEKEAGYHEAVFDASRLASGVYLYRLQAGSFLEIRKMLLVK